MTPTKIYCIDVENPQSVTTIGDHGLDFFNEVYNLAFNNSTGQLFALANDGAVAFLVQFDVISGLGSVVSEIGAKGDVGLPDSLEYVHSLNSLVVSVGISNPTISPNFYTLNVDGTLNFLVNNRRDNDGSVYDSTFDVFYVLDVNNSGQLTKVDLKTGVNMDLGATGAAGSGAFNSEKGGLFAADSGILVNIQTTSGLDPIQVVSVGPINIPEPIFGMAFVDVSVIRGDVNLDGEVNLLDVAPFVDRISTGSFQAEDDINHDGEVNLLDVDPFIANLNGN